MKPGTTESLYGNGELILVIDDEPNTLLMTRDILEERNYRVVCAKGGMEALAMFAAFSEQMSNVRVVLTDIDLPDMKGVALMREIKKLKTEALLIGSETASLLEHAERSSGFFSARAPVESRSCDLSCRARRAHPA